MSRKHCGANDRDFLRKMIVTFAYLLYPLMPPKISKRPLEGIMIYKVVKLLANVDPNYPFTTKQNIFWEVWLLLLSAYCTVLYYNTSYHQTKLQNFAQIGPELPIPPKGNFLEKLTNITLINMLNNL